MLIGTGTVDERTGLDERPAQIDGRSAPAPRAVDPFRSARTRVPAVPPLVAGQRQLDDESVPLTAYADRQRMEMHEVPVSGRLDHTMAHDLDDYVEQRVPAEVVEDALLRSAAIEVHGVYPTHFAAVAARLGDHHIRTVGSLQLPDKRLNAVRPRLFTGQNCYDQERLFLAVPPGQDYVAHYASMVRHVLRRASVKLEPTLAVWRYPTAEREIARWTGLDPTLVEPGDTVVLGKVELLREVFDERARAPQGVRTTEYYSARRYDFPGRRVVVLGVNFSYWGSIAAVLARRCCELGAEEVLYLGKLGTLSRPEDVYSRLFVPSRYGLLRQLQLVCAAEGPPNGLLHHFPSLDSGLHLSVPTVLEEDHRQRQVAIHLGATTLDNELAQMAVAIHGWNAESGAAVRFSGLHYATDYLRDLGEARLPVRHSLASGRSSEARWRRHQAERLAGDCLDRYLAQRGGPEW